MHEQSREIPDIEGRDIATPHSPQAFCQLVDSVLTGLDLPSSALCEVFDVSVDIVDSWRQARHAPLIVGRKKVADYLRLLAASAGREDLLDLSTLTESEITTQGEE